MKCLTVSVNGRVLCAAGMADAFVINIHLGAGRHDESAADLMVLGMQLLSDERPIHVL